MAELKDLSKGDSVTLTVKGEVVSANEGSVDVMYSSGNGDWFTIDESDIEGGTVVIESVSAALPTEDGIYISRNNINSPEGAQLHFLQGGEWSIFDGTQVIEDSLHAPCGTYYAHTKLDGLVRLEPVK